MSSSLPIDLEGLKTTPGDTSLSAVAFCTTGKVDLKILSLLESRGAKKRTNAVVNTTHYIAGADSDEMLLDEARDIFEVPVVTPDWALLCLYLKKIVLVDGFEPHHKKLFSSVVACTSGIIGKDLETIWALITYYGGEFRRVLTDQCTHLISNECSGVVYKIGYEKGVKIVCSDWIVECVKSDSLLEESRFDPSLNVLPVSQNNNVTNTTKTPVLPPPKTKPAPIQAPKTLTPTVLGQQIHQQQVPQRVPFQPRTQWLTQQMDISQNRPMGQLQHKGPFQAMQQQNTQASNVHTMGQPIYRQQQQANQMAMFHPVQQQRLQSPPLTPQQQQQQGSPQIPQRQVQLQQIGQGQPGQIQQGQIQVAQMQQGQMPGQGQIQGGGQMQQQTGQIQVQMQQGQIQVGQIQQGQMPGQGQIQVGQIQQGQMPGQGQIQVGQIQQGQMPGQGQIQVGQIQQGQMPGQGQIQVGQIQQGQMPGQGQIQGVGQMQQQTGQTQVQMQQGQIQVGQIQQGQMPGQGQIQVGQIQQGQMPGQGQIQVGQIQQGQMPGQGQIQVGQMPGQGQVGQLQQPHMNQAQMIPQQGQQGPHYSVVITNNQQFQQNQSPPVHGQQIHQQQQRVPFQPRTQWVTQQMENRPMGQLQHRGQFQAMQQQNTQASNVHTMGQPIYRQQQQTHQMQMFHPIQQQRLQSPPLTPQQQQQQGSPQIPQRQVQLQQMGQGQPGQIQQGQIQVAQMQQGQIQQGQIQVGQIQGGGQMQQQPGQIQVQMQQGQIQTGQMQQGQQPGQLQQPHMNQSQMISPQGQQGQHYSVVITNNNQQQFQQNQSPVHGQPMHQQQGQPQRFQGPRPVSVNAQWTQQQQMEIINQIQRDPLIKAQWAKMDNTQRQLLMQKLAQRKREELLRDMLLRQQHMTQQPPGSPNIGPQQSSPSQQQIIMSPNSQHQQIVPGQTDNRPTSLPLHPIHSPGQQQIGFTSSGQQSQIPMSPQHQILMQTHQDVQKPQSPMVHPNQVLMQNHQHQQIVSQQKVANSQMSPSNPQQKFLAPAPVQTRPTHGVIGSPQQSPQSSGVVRTQQIFTPQVGQQQQQVRIHHVLIQPGQPRPNSIPQQMPNNQKIPLLQQQQPLQINNQWNSSQQRVMTPGPTSPFSNRVPGPPPDSPGGPQPQWTVRPQSQSPQSPGGQSSVSYVQVVNSKTKTALANLLSNRLQGNAGPESTSFTSALTSTTSTPQIQAMCPPPSPPVTSQSLPHSAPTTTQSSVVLAQRRTLANLTNGCKTIQVNSFGSTRVAPSQPSPTMTVAVRPQFFGHDPQAKLPQKYCLFGCVFWITDEIAATKQWAKLVKHFGGTLVPEYSPAVTHIICDTHKFTEFSQGVREGKRMVSPFWINDTVEKQVMGPPSQVIHFPSLFPRNEPPLHGHTAATANFSETDRSRLKILLNAMGAKVTPYFTKFNTFLLCNKPEGTKYQKAREWKKPVVNINFINELYLGHVSALQMIHSPKYQCFNPDQPLRVDYALAPHLMAAWKIPIRVSPDATEQFISIKRAAEESNQQDCTKRIKLENGDSVDSGQSCKGLIEKSIISINTDIDDEPLSPENLGQKTPKEEPLEPIKMEINDSQVIELVDETDSDVGRVTEIKSESIIRDLEIIDISRDENSESMETTPDLTRYLTPSVIVSGFTKVYKDKIAAKVQKLGGKITNDFNEATHLILKEHYLTTKLFLALCRFRHIVSASWIYKSLEEGKFVNERDYGPRHDRFEEHFGLSISQVLAKPARHMLFKGVTFFITPGTWPLKKDAEMAIEAGGGVVDRTQKSLRHIRDYCSRFPKRSVIITSQDDFEIMEDFFMDARRPHVINIYTEDFIWQCIATQKIKLRPTQI